MSDIRFIFLGMDESDRSRGGHVAEATVLSRIDCSIQRALARQSRLAWSVLSDMAVVVRTFDVA